MGGGETRPDERITVRLATPEDLDGIMKVILEGLSDDPKFDYRFPNRDKFPEDNRKWLTAEYKSYLENTIKYYFLVATASDFDDKPVAIAVWDYSLGAPDTAGDLGVPDDPDGEVLREDVNPRHYRQWKKQIIAGFEEYFGKYGLEQWHLWALCTLPAFRGRGAGTRLCKWGLERASKKGVISTVLATDPNGKKLYEKVGWDVQGVFNIRIPGEEDNMDIWPMTHAP